jgi:hypothetical protein
MTEPSTFETERVRRHTADRINRRIDEKTARRIRLYGSQPKEKITRRIDKLEREWDVERWLETNASTLALLGVGLSVTVNRKWLWLSGGVLGFLLLHGLQGWCPPLPVLRRIGVRTRSEIDREKYALKFLRGDFDRVSGRIRGGHPWRLTTAAE